MYKVYPNCIWANKQIKFQIGHRFSLTFISCYFFVCSTFKLNAYLIFTATTSAEEELVTLPSLTFPKFFWLSGKIWVIPTFFVWVNFCNVDEWSLSTRLRGNPTLIWVFPWSFDDAMKFEWHVTEFEEKDSDLVDDVRLLLLAEDESREDDDGSLHPILEAWFELSLTAHFLSRSRTLFMLLIFFVISVLEKKIKSVLRI